MGRKETLCWKCDNAYFNKCPWFTNFTPVKGWEAEPTILKEKNKEISSYRIIKCPNFEKDKIKKSIYNYKNMAKQEFNISERSFFRYKQAIADKKLINSKRFNFFKSDYLKFMKEEE